MDRSEAYQPIPRPGRGGTLALFFMVTLLVTGPRLRFVLSMAPMLQLLMSGNWRLNFSRPADYTRAQAFRCLDP